jgi:hypothetical protein
MRSRARCVLVMAATLLPLLSGVAPAQEKPDATMEVLREKVRADKKLVVALALDLSESEAKGFWPVYGAYQSDMVAHYDRVAKLISDYATAYQKMTDETATQLLGELLALQSDHAALLQRYVPRFQRVLPPRKVARFYQVENKIRAMVDYELARDIPLIE